eukprot:Gb_27570 [translate_table: standard]
MTWYNQAISHLKQKDFGNHFFENMMKKTKEANKELQRIHAHFETLWNYVLPLAQVSC